MEARHMKVELERTLGAPLFLDSDDLKDLRLLLESVRESDVLLLLQSKGLLTRHGRGGHTRTKHAPSSALHSTA